MEVVDAIQDYEYQQEYDCVEMKEDLDLGSESGSHDS
jgi:hypothetical protein